MCANEIFAKVATPENEYTIWKIHIIDLSVTCLLMQPLNTLNVTISIAS